MYKIALEITHPLLQTKITEYATTSDTSKYAKRNLMGGVEEYEKKLKEAGFKVMIWEMEHLP